MVGVRFYKDAAPTALEIAAGDRKASAENQPAECQLLRTQKQTSRSDEMTVAAWIYPPAWMSQTVRVAERRLNKATGADFNRRSATEQFFLRLIHGMNPWLP